MRAEPVSKWTLPKMTRRPRRHTTVPCSGQPSLARGPGLVGALVVVVEDAVVIVVGLGAAVVVLEAVVVLGRVGAAILAVDDAVVVGVARSDRSPGTRCA